MKCKFCKTEIPEDKCGHELSPYVCDICGVYYVSEESSMSGEFYNVLTAEYLKETKNDTPKFLGSAEAYNNFKKTKKDSKAVNVTYIDILNWHDKNVKN